METEVMTGSFDATQSIQYILLTILIVLISTRVYTTVHFYLSRYRTSRPPIPYTIPWIDHLFQMTSSLTEYISSVRQNYPTDPLVTIKLAGRRAHIIFDTKLVGQVHRQPKTMTFEPTGINVAFGVPQKDNETMMSKSSGRVEGDCSGYQDLHNSLVGAWEGENLERMIQFLINQLNKNLEHELASAADCQRAHSESVDLCAWVKRHYTLAAIPYLFGTCILDMWPTLNEVFWHFDSHLIGWDALLRRLGDEEPASVADEEKTDPDWDDYWGERLTRERHRLLLDSGLSERGRAGFHLGFLWAQNANSVPIGLWMLIHTLLDPVFHENVRAAAEPCRKADGTFDLHALVTNPILKPLFLEALRFGVAVAPLRAVTESTLLGGQHYLQKGDLVFLPAQAAQMDAGIWSSSFTGMKAKDPRSDPQKCWAGRFMDHDKSGEDQPLAPSVIETDSSPRMAASHRVEALSLFVGVRSKQLRSQLSHVCPFGGGHWLCPGRNLSMYEIISGLAVLVCRLDIQVEEDILRSQGEPRPDCSRVGGMDPDRPFVVKVQPRLTANNLVHVARCINVSGNIGMNFTGRSTSSNSPKIEKPAL